MVTIIAKYYSYFHNFSKRNDYRDESTFLLLQSNSYKIETFIQSTNCYMNEMVSRDGVKGQIVSNFSHSLSLFAANTSSSLLKLIMYKIKQVGRYNIENQDCMCVEWGWLKMWKLLRLSLPATSSQTLFNCFVISKQNNNL